MTKHANLAPSQSGRWVPCPGSIALVEAMPPEHREESGPYAQLGTAAHGLLERCLSKGHEPEDYMDRIIELIGADEDVSILPAGAEMPEDVDRVLFVVDADMAEAVETAVAYVRERARELDAPDGVRTEVRVRVLANRDDCFGTADVVIDAWPWLLEMADYKNGSGVIVEVEDNYQLRSYLLGAAREDRFSHDLYMFTVIQPRAPHSDGPVRSEYATREGLLEFEAELEGAADRVDISRAILETKGGDAEELYAEGLLEAGDQCRWCEALPTCPAARARAAETAGADFEDEPVKVAVETDPTLLGRVLRWIPFMDSWARATEKHAQRVAESGGTVDDHKLVHKTSKRMWRKEVDVIGGEDGQTVDATDDVVLDIMSDEFDVSNEYMKTVPGLITGPQAEKLVKKGLRADFNARLLHKPLGALTLVHSSDKRDGVTVDPASDFEDGED